MADSFKKLKFRHKQIKQAKLTEKTVKRLAKKE